MSKTLVAYFSASGVTAKVAAALAKAADADLFEIKPAEAYTDADLDYMNEQSRSSVEMKDPSCRPAIAESTDISAYETIFVGFPVWWYREPSIIDTFMEAYDFSGKTVVPFCTSGSSGLGPSGENMQALALDAKVVPGKRLSAGVTEAELTSWVETLSA